MKQIKIEDLDFTGLFGQFEMEAAAKRIVIVTGNNPFIAIKEGDFIDRNEKEGVKSLYDHQWLIGAREPFQHLLSKEFWTRVRERIK